MATTPKKRAGLDTWTRTCINDCQHTYNNIDIKSLYKACEKSSPSCNRLCPVYLLLRYYGYNRNTNQLILLFQNRKLFNILQRDFKAQCWILRLDCTTTQLHELYAVRTMERLETLREFTHNRGWFFMIRIKHMFLGLTTNFFCNWKKGNIRVKHLV